MGFARFLLIEAWRITWTNPAGDHHEQQIGRRVGKDVVQIGTRANGTPTRWTFSEITPDSFHWHRRGAESGRQKLDARGRVSREADALAVITLFDGSRSHSPHGGTRMTIAQEFIRDWTTSCPRRES